MQHSRSRTIIRPVILVMAAAAGMSTLTACGNQSPSEPPVSPVTTTVTDTSSKPTPTATKSETTSKTSAESTSTSEKNGTTSSKAANAKKESEEIATVREKFSSLAPSSLFDAFDSCSPNGIEGSYACSGEKVGQFQFFDSESKAASSTQILTELRSSRVVEDTGDKVVGWSTIGSTALITVVDNQKGLVLQQTVSTDSQEPTDRIYELGLADKNSTATSDSSSTSSASSRKAANN